MSLWRRTLGLALLAGVVVASGEAAAQQAPRASFHDEEARAHYRAGRYEAAVRALFIVDRLAPNPRNHFNIALCFEQLGRAALATYYFSAYLEGGDDAPERRTYAREALARLERRVARVRITSTPTAADVFVDQPEHGSYGRTPVTVSVEPGRHTLWLRADAHRAATATITAHRGQGIDVHLELAPIRGTLHVEVAPPGELLVLDAAGHTATTARSPARLQLPPGVYVVEAAPAGHELARALAKVEADATAEVQLRPDPLPARTGQLVVTANRSGALVEVDGAPLGFTPTILPRVPVGVREVRLSLPGVEPWRGDVEVRPSGRGFVTANLEPPASEAPPPAAWAVGGVGAAALVAGAVVAGVAASHHADFAARLAADRGEDLAARRATGERLNAAADGLWVAGGLSVVAGALLYLLLEPEGGSSADVSWREGGP
jgi:outer membrane receptor for ferrienterochelin and colicins